MTNKSMFLILKLYVKLPERIKSNRIVLKLLSPIVERYKTNLQQQILKARWKMVQLQEILSELQQMNDNTSDGQNF